MLSQTLIAAANPHNVQAQHKKSSNSRRKGESEMKKAVVREGMVVWLSIIQMEHRQCECTANMHLTLKNVLLVTWLLVWLSWLEPCPMHQRVTGSIPS